MKLEHTPFIQKQFSGTNLQGGLSIYTVIKASYDFNDHGKLSIADEQENIVTHDQFYNHPKNSSIYYPEESMPFKQGGELLLMGSIVPKSNTCKQQSIAFKLKYANTEWQKSLTVFGKRYWYNTLMGAKISEPLAITEPVNLQYELSFGGNQYPANPVGKGFTHKWFKVDGIELPQIEYTHALIRSPRSRPYVAGFNAVPKHWQPRLGQQLQKNSYLTISPDMHNTAPLDQQFPQAFQGGEVLSISAWNDRVSLPIPVLYQDKLLAWDTAIFNLNTKKLYLLTRKIERN